MTAPQTIAVAILTIAAAIIALLFVLSWLAKVGALAGDVDRYEDPMEAEERITSIKAALQDDTAHPHVSARNYWTAP